jgi:fluoride exporter
MDLMIVGLGGFLGAISRYSLHLLEKSLDLTIFPLGTLFINVLGCFLAGLVLAQFEQKVSLPRELQLFLMAGFLSSFTTFSTFSSDTFNLLKSGSFVSAGSSILLNLIFGMLALWLGRYLLTQSA